MMRISLSVAWSASVVASSNARTAASTAPALMVALPPAVFGLASGDTTDRASRPTTAAGPRVGQVTIPSVEENDPVRRRAFLQLAAVTGSALAWPATVTVASAADPAQVLTQQLSDILLGSPRVADPAPVGLLRGALTAARREFTACRYLPLANRLPVLLTAAEATAAHQPDRAAQQVLADAYNLATRALIKLEASGLEWISADRALHAARAGEDSLTLAEAQRLVASVARRAGHHDRAQTLTLAAADHLDIASGIPEHLAMHSSLYCSAGYAASRAGDRDRANALLAEAETTANRLTKHPERHRVAQANLVSHKVSAAYLLGDAGAALAHAHSVPLAAIPTTERRARLLVDTAMAYAQWDKPDHAYRTLLAAERAAPGEVRTRNAVRHLVTDLMTAPRQTSMPGLPELARRIHAVA